MQANVHDGTAAGRTLPVVVLWLALSGRMSHAAEAWLRQLARKPTH